MIEMGEGGACEGGCPFLRCGVMVVGEGEDEARGASEPLRSYHKSGTSGTDMRARLPSPGHLTFLEVPRCGDR